MKYRYVVAAAGRRDGYQGAISLAEVDHLERLITDFYISDRSTPLVSKIPGKYSRKQLGRRSDHISSSIVNAWPLSSFIGSRVRQSFGLTSDKQGAEQYDDWIGYKAARITEQTGVGALVYHPHWQSFLYACATNSARSPRILFQFHPVPSQVRHVLSAARANDGWAIPPEPEEMLDERKLIKYEQSVLQADGIIVASTFVKKGLLSIGYPEDRVIVVPYGCPEIDCAEIHTTEETNVPLRLLFVGQIAYRKGLHYLIEAIKSYTSTELQLTIVGRTAPDPEILSNLPANVRVVREISDEQLKLAYRSHDLFVMPSLIEGFGLVYAEALAYGLPVVGTANTGLPDLIQSGREGFLLGHDIAQELAELLGYLVSNRKDLEAMRVEALSTARDRSWLNYRSKFREAVDTIEDLGRHAENSDARS